MNEKTVGMLAKFTGVSVHTIKYYEKIGLLSSTRREHSNYRSYDIRACTDIYECMKYKNLGFALKEVGNLIKEADSEAIDNLLKKRLEEIDASLSELQELKKRGINPDITAGLSLGEYAAVAAAGGMNELDAIKLVRRRGILMQSTVPAGEGAMAAVLGLDAKKIEEILESFENVWIANYNCPGQIVITGLTNEVQQASLALKEAGAKRVVELKVSGPFHSLLLKPAGEALLKEMESMSFSPLQVPYIANATAEIVTDSKKISTFFAKGIYSSVRWQQSIETMLENGVDTFVEIGPGKTLAGFMRKIAPKATVYNVSSFEDAIALEKCLSKA